MRARGCAVIALVMTAPFVASFQACGPGGAAHPPSISNLVVQAPATVDGVTGTASVWGQLSFNDSGGDVGSLWISTEWGTTSTPIPSTGGITSGTGSATMILAPGRYGTTSFQVWVVDQAGAESNHLSGSIKFVPEDGGRRWTRVSPLPGRAVAHAAGSGHARNVVVGEQGLILTSDDGVQWAQESSNVTVDLLGVAWSGTRFVAVGEEATVLTSEDGHAWVSTAEPVPGMVLHDVSWGNGTFVAVGGSTSDPQIPLVRLSRDGNSWNEGTFVPAEPLDQYFFQVVWGSGRWVATGHARWSSPDGETWSSVPFDYSPSRNVGLGWNGAQFVCAGVDYGFSADGLNWTPATREPVIPHPRRGVAWSGERWMAIGQFDVATSTDGNHWDDWGFSPAPFTDWEIRVVWDGDRYPARYLAAGGGGVWTSP